MSKKTKQADARLNRPGDVWGAVVGSSVASVSAFAIAVNALEIGWAFWATIGLPAAGLAVVSIEILLAENEAETPCSASSDGSMIDWNSRGRR